MDNTLPVSPPQASVSQSLQPDNRKTDQRAPSAVLSFSVTSPLHHAVVHEEDALQERNITEAIRKFSLAQGLTPPTGKRKSVSGRRTSKLSAIPEVGQQRSQIDIKQSQLKVDIAAAAESTASKGDKLLTAGQFRELLEPLSSRRQKYIQLRDKIVDDELFERDFLDVKIYAKKLWGRVIETVDSVSPVQRTLRWIDSQYGSDVYAYFSFMVWLIMLNLASLAVIFFIGLVPSITYVDTVAGRTITLRDPSIPQRPSDILTGNGSFKHSALHYGFYQPDTNPRDVDAKHDRTIAYLLAMAGAYLIPFLATTYSLTRAYRQIINVATMRTKQHFCDSVFFLWEFSTHSADQIELAKSHLRTRLREMIAAHDREDRAHHCNIIFRVLMNSATAIVVGGISAGLWQVFQALQRESATGYHVEKQLTPIFFITIANLAFTFLFAFVTKFEQSETYETELSLSMLKGLMLNFGTIGTMFFYWMFEQSGQPLEVLGATNASKNCSIPRLGCWETEFSMKFYQLAMMNFIFEWGLVIIFGAAVALHHFWKKDTERWRVVFRADILIQRAFYLQILTWTGMFYSPMIGVLSFLSMVLSFMRDIVTIRSTRLYKSAPLGSANESTQVVYSSALLLSFIICASAVAFGLSMMMPSSDCGPLRTLCPDPDIVSAALSRVRSRESTVFEILDAFCMPTFLFWIILFLLVFIFYFRIKARALDELLPVLHNHLAMESRDVTSYYLNLLQFEQHERDRLTKSASRQLMPSSNKPFIHRPSNNLSLRV